MSRFLSAILGCAVACGAWADGAEPAWTPVAVTVGPLDPKCDLQGFFEGYERMVDGDVIEAYGHKIAFRNEGAAWSYGVDGGAATPVKAWPAAVAFGQGADARGVLIGPRGNTHVWSAHYGARFKLGAHEFMLVDADADGVLFEPNEDGLVGPYSKTVMPYTGWAWTEDGNWELRSKEGVVEQRSTGLPRRAGVHPINDAWRLFNAWRGAAGCGYVAWNEDHGRNCRAHADYSERNQERSFREDESKPGYSDEGDQAGRQSIMSFIYDVPREAILEYLATAYSLSFLLAPEMRECGMAISGRTFCANVNADRSGPSHPGAVQWVWPPHGTRDLMTAFNDNGEVPMPVPGEELNHYFDIGHAIVARVDDTGKDYTIELTTDKGEKIEGYLTCPGGTRPDHEAVNPQNNGLVIFAPRKLLPVNSRFTARLRFIADDEREIVREWTFATGVKVHRVICPLKRLGRDVNSDGSAKDGSSSGVGSGSGSGSGRGGRHGGRWSGRPPRDGRGSGSGSGSGSEMPENEKK